MGMMRTLISEIKEARRLTLTFRFNTASFALDNKALADVNRLRALLDTPEYKSKTVYLIGFADAIGSFATNMKLAERRAAAVHKALVGNRPSGVRSLRRAPTASSLPSPATTATRRGNTTAASRSG